jgi:hypothetical protein
VLLPPLPRCRHRHHHRRASAATAKLKESCHLLMLTLYFIVVQPDKYTGILNS